MMYEYVGREYGAVVDGDLSCEFGAVAYDALVAYDVVVGYVYSLHEEVAVT